MDVERNTFANPFTIMKCSIRKPILLVLLHKVDIMQKHCHVVLHYNDTRKLNRQSSENSIWNAENIVLNRKGESLTLRVYNGRKRATILKRLNPIERK